MKAKHIESIGMETIYINMFQQFNKADKKIVAFDYVPSLILYIYLYRIQFNYSRYISKITASEEFWADSFKENLDKVASEQK